MKKKRSLQSGSGVFTECHLEAHEEATDRSPCMREGGSLCVLAAEVQETRPFGLLPHLIGQ